MIELEDIQEVCKNTGGVKSILITDVDNINEALGIANATTSYSIFFRRGTSNYREEENTGEGGDYSKQTLSAIIPRRRATVEVLRRRVRDKRWALIVMDWLEEQYVMVPSRISLSFATGQRKSETNGYTLRATAVDLKRGYYVIVDPTVPNNNQGVEEGGDDLGGGGIDDGGDPTTIGDCCITVNPAQLAYIPTPTGNQSNLNEMVIAADGSRWFISREGDAIRLSSSRTIEVLTPTTSSFGLAPPASIIDNDDIPVSAMMVFRNGSLLRRDSTDIDGYTISVSGNLASMTMPPDWPIESNETITIYYL